MLKVILTICPFSASVSPPLLCFYCPFLGSVFLQITHSLLPGLFPQSFNLQVHPEDNTSCHPLFSPLVPFAGSCHVPGFISSSFCSQCFLPALVLLFASQMFPHGCCAWGCLFSWRICLCTDLSIRFCLNEFQLLFLLVLSPFHCHHFLCELQWRSVSKSKLLEVMECKVFDSDSWFFLC